MDGRRGILDALVDQGPAALPLINDHVDSDPDYWYGYMALGRLHMAMGDTEAAIDDWVDAFDRMETSDFDESFRTVANLLEDGIAHALWRSLDELHIDNIDDLAYVIFTNFPEKRCEDTDLLIVMLKRLNAHLDDIKHVRYLVDLMDTAEMLTRKYFDMNVEIRTHMYASDIILGMGSLVILKTIPMLEVLGDKEESLRTIRIIGEIVSIFTKIRDTIFFAVNSRSREEIDAVVSGWSRRCTEPYMMHLARAFEISMSVHDGGRLSPEAMQEERDREVERYVEAYFSPRSLR